MRASTSLVSVALVVLSVAEPAHAQPARDLPLVYVLATGGTIAGQGASSTSLADYKPGSVLGEQLVAAVPEIRQVANVKVEQIANVGSHNITVANWLTLAQRINALFRDDAKVAGVVVTHGTNTLEETAYFLNLTVRHDRPVVVVGAMRPSTAISADGPLNLLNAVRVAGSPEARGKGVLVVLNDEINAARDVTKTNTYRVETFRGGELGLLGYVDEDKVSFYRTSTRRHTQRSEFDVSGLKDLPKVEIVYSYVQPSIVVGQALVADGARGIVVAGSGAGGMSDGEENALKPLLGRPAESRPVVVRSSRVGNGRVIGGPGGPRATDKLGMIAADNLNPQKARVLLMLALTKTHDVREIQRMFNEY